MTQPDLKPLEVLAASYGRSLARGETIPVDGHLVVLLSGRAAAMDEPATEGAPVRMVRSVQPGDFVGEECLLDRASTLHLRALQAAQVLLIPSAAIRELYHASPDYALHLTRTLYRRLQGTVSAIDDAVEPTPPKKSAYRQTIATKIKATAQTERPPAAITPLPKAKVSQSNDQPAPAAPLTFNEEWFYADNAVCPACQTAFQYVRVRTRAVHSTKRESDFYYHYRSVNPLHYAIIVCPNCRYAAYSEDFEKLSPEEAQRVNETAPERLSRIDDQFGGERDLAMVAASFRLALSCYRARESEARRIAGLLHRLAWIAREADDEPTERRYLEEALREYVRAWEQDRGVSDAKGVTLAYFIGELSLRIEQYEDAVQWFARLTQMEESRRHPEILRLTRERWADALLAQAERKGAAREGGANAPQGRANRSAS